MSITKKVFAAAITATTVVSMLGLAALPLANAQSTSSLQAQIAALLAQIQQLQGQLNGGSSTTGTTMTYDFTNDLTVGSTGAQVSSLQQLLISKGYLTAVSAPTGYFGALTQKALAAFQAANGISPAVGYFGPKTRAFVNAMSTTTTTTTTTTTYPAGCTSSTGYSSTTGQSCAGGTTTTVAPATGLSVSLASDNPSAGALISSSGSNTSGAARVPVMAFTLTAGNSGAVTVTQIQVNKTGVLSDNAISGAYLIQNGQVVAQYNSINSGVITFSGLNLSIGAGQSQEYTFAIDVSGGLSAGNTTGFSIESASDITAWTGSSNTAVTPTGNFPLNGNTFTVTQVSNPSLASLQITSSSIGTQVTAGTQGNLVGAWNFTVNNSPVWLDSLNFHVIGSANLANIQNVKLEVNGTQVGTTLSAANSNGTAYFDLTSPVKLNTGSNQVEVLSDVMGSPSDFFQFEILNGYDVLAVDSQYNVPVSVTNTGGVGTQVSIQQGQITVTQDANTPTGNIAAGVSSVPLAKFDIYAAGEPIKVEFLGFDLAFTGVNVASDTALSQIVKNISITDDAGGQVGSTINTPPSSNSCDVLAGTGAGYYNPGGTWPTTPTTTNVTYSDCFGTSGSPINYQIPANTTRVLTLKADIQSGANFGTVTGNLLTETTNNLQGIISSRTTASTGANGSALTLVNNSLTVTQNNALGAQNISAGVTSQKIGSFSFQASSAQGVNVNNVQIEATPNSNNTYFQNLHLMVNGAQFGSTQGTVGGEQTYTFSGTPFSIPAGGTVNVDVYADTLSSATGSISTATKLTGCSATGQISYSSISCSSVNGQNLSFGGSPMITVAADSTEPPAAQVVMGSTGNTLGVYRFTETSNIENVKVTTLNIVDAVSSTAAVKAAFSNLQLWNGSTLLGTAGAPTADIAGTGYLYTFNLGSPILIPQANSVSITLKGDAASYSSQGATDDTLHQFEIATTTDSSNNLSSSTVVALGATSNKPTTVTLSSANGNVNTVLRTTLAASVAPLGVTSGRSKSNPDNFGTITLTANSAGPAALDTLKVTFSGSAASSSLFTTSSISLVDQNGNIVNVGTDGLVSEVVSSTAGTALWTFGTNQNGFQISAGGSYTFTLRLNTTVVPGTASVSQSLSANIQNPGDVTYTDALDASSTPNLTLTTAAVPLTINSVSYAQGN